METSDYSSCTFSALSQNFSGEKVFVAKHQSKYPIVLSEIVLLDRLL